MNPGTTGRSTSVVIPSYNEAATIGDIVSRVRAVDADFEVIVVDDGSADDTAGKARDAGAVVIRHPYNLGNGASVKAGCLRAEGDVVVMLDADDQHPPEEIPRLLEWIGEYDMCVAARTSNSKTSRLRNAGNFLLNRIATWISDFRIVDLTSGFRAIKREHLMEYIHLFPKSYSYPTTITMAFVQGNRFIKYVPVDSIQKRHHGESNIRPFRDFVRFVNVMLRLVILFSPQKFFVPLSVAVFAGGAILGLYQLVRSGGIFGGSLLLMLSSVYFFCFGLLAEQIARLRREK